MNEDAAVNAVYTVVYEARATLVGSLTQSGQARSIEHIEKTLLQTPAAYYAIGIHCDGANELSMPRQQNLVDANTAIAWVEYDMVVRMGDFATPDTDQSFVTAHANFRKLCDRVVKLIRQTTKWFPTAGSDPRFRLRIDPDTAQNVRKENDTLEPLTDGTFMLGCSIRFTLIDHCSDSSLLYS